MKGAAETVNERLKEVHHLYRILPQRSRVTEQISKVQPDGAERERERGMKRDLSG